MAKTKPSLCSLVHLFLPIVTLVLSVIAGPLRNRYTMRDIANPTIPWRAADGTPTCGGVVESGASEAFVVIASNQQSATHNAAKIDHAEPLGGGARPRDPSTYLAAPYPPPPSRHARRLQLVGTETSVSVSSPGDARAHDTRTAPQVLSGSDEQPVKIAPRDGGHVENGTEVEIAVGITKATAGTNTTATELGSATAGGVTAGSSPELVTPADATSDGDAGEQLSNDIQSVVQRILQICVQIIFDNAATVGFLIALCTVLYLCGLRIRWKPQKQSDEL